MEKIIFFDANASFGPRMVLAPGVYTEKEKLLEQMKRYGIAKALVYHSLGKEYHPAQGNEKLLCECSGNEALVPMWVIMPHHTGEFDAPGQLARRMKEHYIRATTMFPSPAWHGFGCNDVSCGALFDMLEEHKIPLFLEMEQAGGLDGFLRLALAHPKLRLVLTNVNYRIDRALYPLLERCENVWVETSGYKPFMGLETICTRYGAHRFLFGSGMPYLSCGASVSLVTYADISVEDKRKIAAENLTNLLNEVTL